MNSLTHDVAFATTSHLLELVDKMSKPDYQGNRGEEVYAVIRAALEYYDERAERRDRRLRPLHSKN